MIQADLFPAPRLVLPSRQEKPKPPPYVPDFAAVKAREARILAALPGTLDDILRRASQHLSQSATLVDLAFMARDGLITRTAGPEPVYSVVP